ncbi:MAG: FAD-dependent oxidoreductase [Fuerstiella sp.]|nr:FAD-dependent oxidoreductase [Fuerstiella sp.]MCP4857407.1 FAD-dependent oxidoreductase [Fuerstiella sp.]
MSNGEKHTVVIGGGVIGAFCAWYLTAAGRTVTIIDREEFGAGCSHGNCGYVSPSHVLPLTAPGQIGRGLKGMISRNEALRIHPRLSPTFWKWMIRFALRCNRRNMLQAGRGRTALLESSRKLYEEVITTQGLQVEWTTNGLLFVYRDKPEFEDYAATDQLLRDEFGVAAEPIDGEQLSEMEPALKTGLAGAWHYRNDGHLRPDLLMTEMHRTLLESGVQILPQREMNGFVASADGTAAAVSTNSENIEADEFVVATGPLTPMLNAALGCRIPIEPGKGYSITMARPKICPRYPMLLEEAHVGITPFANGYRIGSTMEFAGYDSRLSPERLQYLRDGAAEYLVEPTAEPVEEEWFGWRPMTWDGLPYIDRTPRFGNVWVAAGHNMLGLSMGPATGKLISEMITGQAPHIDSKPYCIGR